MTSDDRPGPLLVTGPDTLLLQVDHPDADACRAELAVFAELERSPEHVHTYRLTDLGLWNAKAAGVDAAAGKDHLFSRAFVQRQQHLSPFHDQTIGAGSAPIVQAVSDRVAIASHGPSPSIVCADA